MECNKCGYDDNGSGDTAHACTFYQSWAQTKPPQRTWVGLTDEEVTWLCNTAKSHDQTWGMFVRSIEAKLKEKNT